MTEFCFYLNKQLIFAFLFALCLIYVSKCASIEAESWDEYRVNDIVDEPLSRLDGSDDYDKSLSALEGDHNSQLSTPPTPTLPRHGLPIDTENRRNRPQNRKKNKFPVMKKENEKEEIRQQILKAIGIENRTMNDEATRLAPKILPTFMLNLYNEVTNRTNARIGHSRNPYDASTIRCMYNNAPKKNKLNFKFDLSAIPASEQLLHAELHLFKLMPKTKNVNRRQSFYQIHLYRLSNHDGSSKLVGYRLLSARGAGWEIFNVVGPVRDWIENPERNLGFQINVTSLAGDQQRGGPVRFAQKNHDSRQPILIIFTKDNSENDNQRTDIPAPEEILAASQMIRPRQPPQLPLPDPSQEHKVVKRDSYEGRQKEKGCARESMFVDFRSLGWTDFIVVPAGYNAYKCSGSCPFPVKEDLHYSVHALIQSYVALGTEVSTPCCVPHRLGHIIIVFFDTYDNLVLKQVNDMVVEECGCR